MRPSETRSASLGLSSDAPLATDAQALPVEICLLGDFRLLKGGKLVSGPTTGKVEALLSSLALGKQHGVPREMLLGVLWPERDAYQAGQSLNSLMYSLRRLLAGQIVGRAPIVSDGGTYRLNFEAGIGVDVARFDALAVAGHRHHRAGDRVGAAQHYARAIDLYHGDLCAVGVPGFAIERERLRAGYLTLLARLADFHFQQGDAAACLHFAQALLSSDPCREDALRLVMRSYVRCGERAQALRQFRLSELTLRAEFDAAPEPATLALWDQVRLHPESV